MGTVRQCLYPQTSRPYRVEETGIRLYSMEELAYYLYENIYLVDEQLIGDRLYDWLEKEFGLKKLADKLRNGNNTGSLIYNQVIMILKASEYYTKEEISELTEKIRKIGGMQLQERMKYKADELLKNENYWASINEYDHLLSIRQSTRLEVSFYAAVWNNLGCAYAGLFLFGKAAECFENAYRFQKLPEYQKQAYAAKKLAVMMQENPEETLEDRLLENEKKQSDEEIFRLKAGADREMSEEQQKGYLKEQEQKILRIFVI